MRYIALILILLAFVFFVFVKPKLRFYSVDIKPGDIELSANSVSARGLTLYVFAGKNRAWFLYIGNLSLNLGGKKSFLEIKNSSFIAVNLKKAVRRREPIKLRSFSFIKAFNLKFENLYISILGYRSSLTTFLDSLSLKDEKIIGKADFYYLSRRTRNRFSIDLKRATVRDEGVFIESVLVESPLYSFNGKGVWRWGEGNFSSKGFIKTIDTQNVHIPRIDIQGEGKINLTGIKIKAVATAPLVRVKGRKDFTDVRANGKIKIVFGVKNYLEGSLWNRDIEADYLYKIFPDRELLVHINSGSVDGKLIGIDKELRAEVKGTVKLLFGKEKLSLSLTGSDISFEENFFRHGNLELDVNLKGIPQGNFSLELSDTGYFVTQGEFRGSYVKGSYQLRKLPLFLEELRGVLTLSGRFEKDEQRNILSSGSGLVESLQVRGISLGSARINYSLAGDELKLRVSSPSYRGFVHRGKESVKAKFRLNNFESSYEGVYVSVSKGRIEFLSDKENTHISLFMDDGLLSYGEVKLKGVQGVAYVNPKKEEGFLGVHIKELRLRNFVREKGYLFGKYNKGFLEGLYSVKGLINGSYRFSPSESAFRTQGEVKLEEEGVKLSAIYVSRLERDTLTGNMTGDISFGNRSLPVKLRFKAEENILSMNLEPTSYQDNHLSVELGGVELKGSWQRLDLKVGTSSVKVLGKKVFSLSGSEGYILPPKRELHLDEIKLKGVLDGKLSVHFINRNLELSSKGKINLSTLSLVFGSLMKSNLEGYINYSAGYTEGEPYLEMFSDNYFTVRSSYLALPMSGSVNLSLKGNKLNGYLLLFNPISKLLVGFEPKEKGGVQVKLNGDNLPLRYISEGIRAVIYADGKGKVDINSLEDVNAALEAKLSGNVKVTRSDFAQAGDGDKGLPNLPFKFLLSITPSSPIRVVLPEGYVNLKPGGVVTNSSGELMYAISLNLISGEANYFGRDFFIKRGWILLEKKTKERKYINLSITNVEDGVFIYVDLIGELPLPKIYLRSDPPMDRREILTRLVLGGITEGVIPVVSSLITEFTYFTELRRNVSGLLGLDIRFLTHTDSQGDIGLNVLVSKKLSNILRLEYQQSTLKNPWATFYGASILLEPLGISVGTRVYSDNTKGVRFRIRRKFDF